MGGEDTRLRDDFLANIFFLGVVDVEFGGADATKMVDDLHSRSAGSSYTCQVPGFGLPPFPDDISYTSFNHCSISG
jgi:hypothetical protein